jgi:hypothetical protein
MIQIELTYTEIRARLPGVSVAILQRLGADPVTGRALVCDGVDGPRTKGAVYLNPDCVTDPAGVVALKELLAGAEEELGRNDGPDVHKYAQLRGPYVKGKDLWAWCALFVSWCLCQVWASFGKVSGAIRLVRDHTTQVQLHELRPGDVVAWWSVTRPRPYGHVGLVVAITALWVWTIEGNVDLRERIDGVAARRLPRATLKRIDGAPLAYCGRYLPRVTPHAPTYAALSPSHHDLDELSGDDDHCA